MLLRPRESGLLDPDGTPSMSLKRLWAYYQISKIQKNRPYKKFLHKLKTQDMPQISATNLLNLKNTVAPLSPNQTKIFNLMVSLEVYLKHATKHLATIQKSGVIFGCDEVRNRGIPVKDNADDNFFNTDFVFFRFDTNDGTAKGSRFGPTTFVLDARVLFEGGGFVYFHDLGCPGGEIKNPVLTENIQRELSVYENWEDIFPTMHARYIINNNYNPPCLTTSYPLLERFFYGPDIREGIAYSLVLEIKNMGEEGGRLFEDYILGSPDPSQKLRELLPRFYRIQALVPNQVRSEELKKCLFSRDYMDFSVY